MPEKAVYQLWPRRRHLSSSDRLPEERGRNGLAHSACSFFQTHSLVESSEAVERMDESHFPTSEFVWKGNISHSVDLSTNGRKR